MFTLRVIGLVVPLVAGCIGNVQRSARVPHAAVPLNSGQPLGAPAEASAGLSNVTDVIKPRVGDPSQAVEIPATQMRNELRLRIRDRAQLGFIYEHGFGATSQKPDETQAPVGDGDVMGAGMSFGYSIETSTPGLSIGTTVELMQWSVPYVEYETCTNCLGNIMVIDHDRATPMTLGVGVSPSFRRGTVTVFGGAFARNHPTTQRKSHNVGVIFDEDDGDVKPGTFNVLLHVGVEVELQRWLSALLLINQDLMAAPVQYGPGIGIALNARLGL